MTLLIGFFGVLLITVVLWDVFETIVLPRRVTPRVRLTRLFYRFTWSPWWAIAGVLRKKKGRDAQPAITGPLSLLVLLTLSTGSVLSGLALLLWPIGSGERTAETRATCL